MSNNYAIITQYEDTDDDMTMGFENSTTQPTMEDNDMENGNMTNNVAINNFDANMHSTNNVNYSNNNTNITTNSSHVPKKRKKLVQSTLSFDGTVSRKLKPTKVGAKKQKSIKKSKAKKTSKSKKAKVPLIFSNKEEKSTHMSRHIADMLATIARSKLKTKA